MTKTQKIIIVLLISALLQLLCFLIEKVNFVPFDMSPEVEGGPVGTGIGTGTGAGTGGGTGIGAGMAAILRVRGGTLRILKGTLRID